MTAALAPTTAQLVAVARPRRRAPKGARATWDERFGTPRTVDGTGGYLTGARSGSAVDVARGWVADNRDAFGMSAAQVAALRSPATTRCPAPAPTSSTFTQVFDGVAAVQGGRLNVAVTKDGRVLSYAGNPTRGVAARRLVRDSARPGARLRRRRS